MSHSTSLIRSFSLGCVAVALASCGNGEEPVGNTLLQPSSAQNLSLADCAMIVQEDFVTRNELAEGDLKRSGNLLLRFVQFSDDHVIDDDGQATNGASATDSIEPVFDSAQRLQEEYSDEVLNDMVVRVNECQELFPSEFMIVTGDSADLTTIAETRRFIDNLDGTFDQLSVFEETCRSGYPAETPEELLVEACTRFTGRGVADTQSADFDLDDPVLKTTTTRSIAQLANTTAAVLGGRDAAGEFDPMRQTATRSPGLPEVLRCNEGDEGCVSQSLKMPWMVAFGNHDGYLRGTAAAGTGVNEASISTGRYHIENESEFIAEFFRTSSLPEGHGFNFADEDRRSDSDLNNDGYYAFDAGQGKFRMIVLNTIIDGRDPRLPSENIRNFAALADGTIDAAQFEWLKGELESAWTNEQLVMVFSHHPDLTFAEYGTGAAFVPIDVTAVQLDGLLASYPNVLAWVAGHTHRHRIRAFKVTDGVGDNGTISAMVECKVEGACNGFWQIESASLIDEPQEQRLFEIIDNRDGTGVIRSPVITHNFEKSKAMAQVDDRCQFYFTNPDQYEQLSNSEADLESLCAFGGTRKGQPTDRNVNLMFEMPKF